MRCAAACRRRRMNCCELPPRSRRRWRRVSLASGTSNSAAADGVGARKSAAKSAIVKSTSWPTALTTGIALARIARATASSLNAHRSSSEPPPRVSNSTSWRSAFDAAACSMATMAGGASLPCTGTGRISTSTNGKRRPITLSTSRIAAPRGRGDHTDASRQLRNRRACARHRTVPSAASFALSCSNARSNAPSPASSRCSTIELEFAARLVQAHARARQHAHAVGGLEAQISRCAA